MFFTIIKIVFMLSLFLIFFKYFGYPSYIRFHKKDTVFSENQVPVDPTRPVMVTIIAWKYEFGVGWKEQPNGYTNLGDICNPTDTYENLIECVNKKTFRHEDIITRSAIGNSYFGDEIDVTNISSWTQGITTFIMGKFHSVKIFPTIFNKEHSQQEWRFNIYLKHDQKYFIIIHDPDFFVLSTSPASIPKIYLNMDDSRSHYVIIKAVYTSKINKPKYPCIPDKSYSFTRCVADSVNAKVGCRIELDSLSSEDTPNCTTVEQIMKIAKAYDKIVRMTQTALVNYTRCTLPCNYVEFQLVEEPVKTKDVNQTLDLVWLNTHALERTEQLLYPLESFVSEFGGALGLFLGFSCMMVCDVLQGLINLWSKYEN